MFQHIHTLLVEDDEIEIESIRRSFRKQQFNSPLTIVHDGIEAFTLLCGQNGQLPFPRPYLILLDIYLPRMNGLEFLQTLRQAPDLKRSPVFMLTSSRNEEDIRAAYQYGVAGYIVKDKVGQNHQDLIKLLVSYLTAVSLGL